MAQALVAAAMSAPWPPWSLEASSWLASTTRGARYWAASYHEGRGGWARLLLEHPLPVDVLVRSDFMAGVASAGGVCSYSGYTLPSGSHAAVAACTARPLGREALFTASPPQPQRRLPQAVLERYVARLLGEGVSLWRLAALLATTAGGQAAAMLVLVEKPGRPPAPLVYVAARRPGLCVSHSGAAVEAWTAPGCPARVVHARPSGGAVRVEVKTLEEALRG